jgi:hypothetical protein
MSDSGAAIRPEAAASAPEARRSRVNLFVFLSAVGTIGVLLFWLYKTVKELVQPVEDVKGIIGRLRGPRRKARTRIIVKRRTRGWIRRVWE